MGLPVVAVVFVAVRAVLMALVVSLVFRPVRLVVVVVLIVVVVGDLRVRLRWDDDRRWIGGCRRRWRRTRRDGGRRRSRVGGLARRILR